MRTHLLALLLLLASGTCPAQSRAQQIFIPPLMRVDAGAQPIELAAASVLVEPAVGVAQTTIELTFRNPNDRPLEGGLEFPLRPGQQVVGFALDIDGHMRDAVPVEKARGRQVFEAIERERADPGLLEQTQGEFFRLRVFPLPPRGTRRVRVVLVEPMRAGREGATVTVPLDFARGLPSVPVEVLAPAAPKAPGAIAAIAVQPLGQGRYRLQVPRGSAATGRDLVLLLPLPAGPSVQTQDFGGQRYFVAELPVSGAPVARRLPARIGLLWDSSMSGRKRAHDLEFALLDRYFKAAGTAEVELVRLRDVAEPTIRFRVADGDWSALRTALEATVYDGASRLDGWRPQAGIGEYLLVSDGLFNYGSGLPALGASQRLYTLRAGVAGDAGRLAALAHAHGGRALTLDGSDDLNVATRRLLEEGVRLARVDALDATDVVAESPFPIDGRLRLAGRITGAGPRLALALTGPSGPQRIEVDLADAVDAGTPARVWARYRIAALRADPTGSRGTIARLGRDFGLVTPETSLIVLENVPDYVRHGIRPPADLQADYARLLHQRDAERASARVKQLDGVARRWNERIAWWERRFDKGPPPAPKDIAREEESTRFAAPTLAAPPPPAPPAPAPSPRHRAAQAVAAVAPQTLASVEVTGTRVADDAAADAGIDAGAGLPQATMRVQPWLPDSPFARRLRAAPADAAYALYLDERERGEPAPAFFLDVADLLFEKGDAAHALRVLSNLAELQLEDRHVLRVLAYRLVQADRADLALPVLERVLEIGEEEPQSFRDLALAHAALGHGQKAVDLLYEVVTGTWDGRFADIEVIALAELNALVATSPTPLDTSRVRPEFLRNLPLGLRTVLSWDSDNSDMDLWVTDPNGERAYYANPLTYQGGRMSRDFTGGYGPEEFALRNPKPGTYRVEAHYFGDRQQALTGPTTLQLWLSTGFGTARQKDEHVTLRLTDPKERIFVGEFKVE